MEVSLDIGCMNKEKHELNKGNAQPVPKNLYKLAHSLKSVVEEQINNMLKRVMIFYHKIQRYQ